MGDDKQEAEAGDYSFSAHLFPNSPPGENEQGMNADPHVSTDPCNGKTDTTVGPGKDHVGLCSPCGLPSVVLVHTVLEIVS